MTTEELERIMDEVLAEHPDKVAELQHLENKTIGRYMGLVMKQNKMFNPEVTKQIIRDKINV
jgi:Asp-tRNA(Asn)/Glu-tRNA(Gln) amidotransferase B subunit